MGLKTFAIFALFALETKRRGRRGERQTVGFLVLNKQSKKGRIFCRVVFDKKKLNDFFASR